MADSRNELRSGREVRLLLLVVGVSIAVLLLLAQWRFPSAAGLSGVTPSAAPLADLAARASFDEMGSAMADVLGRISPGLVVVTLDTPVTRQADRVAPSPRRGTPTSEPPAPPPVKRVLGLRVGLERALIYLPGAETFEKPAAVVKAVKEPEPQAPGSERQIVSADVTRSLALVRVDVPTSPVPDLFSNAVRSFSGLSYVAVVEPLQVGPTIQPVFIGRTDAVIDARWSHPIILVGPPPTLAVGAYVFSVGGRLIGLVSSLEGRPVIVPALALETMVAALESQGSAE